MDYDNVIVTGTPEWYYAKFGDGFDYYESNGIVYYMLAHRYLLYRVHCELLNYQK